MSDAIWRNLGRLYLTHRRLLEWTTAAQAKSDMSREITGVYRRMRGAPILVVVGGALIALARPDSAVVAAPFLLLWSLSPLVARWVSRPPRLSPTPLLSPADARTLRSAARRTWRFFEAFVGPADHDLPPDNFQEDPKPVVAHRTSPTNIGLYLLSTAAARDFGWLGLLDTVERLEATFETLTKMERFHGHYYNWYETRTLRALEPPYVSSVDSGNLAGHLLTLAQACRELTERPLLVPSALGGVEDALGLVRESAAALPDHRRTEIVTRRQLADAVEAVATALGAAPNTPAAWARCLGQLDGLAHTLVDVAGTLYAERGDGAAAELLAWSRAVAATVQSHARDMDTLLPWALPGGEDDGDHGLLATVPAPAELSDRCAAADRKSTRLN